MRRLLLPSLLTVLLTAPLWSGEKAMEETVRFGRPAGKAFVPEAAFTIRRDKEGWEMESVTGRGKVEMRVSARYDALDRLRSASATLSRKDHKAAARVEVDRGKAKVLPLGKPEQEFDVPAGVLVTSAPDWSDIFLLCRHWDAKKKGKQEFAGLWIHPEQKAQLLKFTIELEGMDRALVRGKEVALNRFRIAIRGPNPYLAWADAEGVLVKLVPLPYKEGSGLIRAGWEDLWGKLVAGDRP